VCKILWLILYSLQFIEFFISKVMVACKLLDCDPIFVFHSHKINLINKMCMHSRLLSNGLTVIYSLMFER
jgi:ABC-type polysaccharide/polyol phosphate transport system ATPase subunit